VGSYLPSTTAHLDYDGDVAIVGQPYVMRCWRQDCEAFRVNLTTPRANVARVEVHERPQREAGWAAMLVGALGLSLAGSFLIDRQEEGHRDVMVPLGGALGTAGIGLGIYLLAWPETVRIDAR
jgi:hypothetical protein